VADLRTWNRIRTPSVRTGTRLRIRNASDAPADSAALATVTTDGANPDAVSPATAVARDTRVSKPARARTHTVKAGETLSTIATRHGVTVTQLKKLNHLTTNRIRTGQRLRLPA
jgi:membrane-bound lytic murein transglycosylase D